MKSFLRWKHASGNMPLRQNEQLHSYPLEFRACTIMWDGFLQNPQNPGPEAGAIDNKPPPLIFKARWITKTEPNALETIQLIKVVFKLKYAGRFGEVRLQTTHFYSISFCLQTLPTSLPLIRVPPDNPVFHLREVL